VKKKTFLAEQVSAILQNNNDLKYKDPDCPIISCFIGEHKVERALLDLGASVNLLPYSVFQSLNLGELKPTSVILFNMAHFSNISDRVKDAKNEMDKAQQALHTGMRIQFCACEKGMLFINTLLPSGLKRVFSNRRQGYNGLAWGIRILATFTN